MILSLFHFIIWLTPSGKSISDGGLDPDFIVNDENTPDDVDLFEYQLEEAIRLLNEI
jgi:C-terminal processing protease CtpA/Prc